MMTNMDEVRLMKASFEKFTSRITKYPVTVWMLISVFTFCTVVVGYSAYSGTVDVKRVVSTQSSSTTMFSSNYMESSTNSGLIVKNLHTINEGNFTCNVTVCNYDQLDQSNPAHSLITYDFTAELFTYTDTYQKVTETQLNMQGTPKIFSVRKVMDNNGTITTDTEHDINSGDFSYTYSEETLTGGTSCKDSFDICFDSEEVKKELPDLFIRVTATPTAQSIQLNGTLPTLSSIISISKGRIVETGWYGSLIESSNSDIYDAYNLVIEGSGAGTIDILWDSTEFTINPAFLAINSSKLSAETTDSSGLKKRTLTVNSSEENRYVVQFYKSTSYTGNSLPSNAIKCENYVVSEHENTP